MDYALVFKWIKPMVGREAKALEVLADIRVFFGKLFADGKIEEPLLLEHPNDGMMIVRGEMTFLFEIMNREDFILLIDKAMYVAEGFHFDEYFIGEAADHRMGLYAKAGRELAFI